jgi:hypothetical protein
MCISRYLREVEAGWEASVRLLAQHFLQFASSELEKSISRLSMWLVVAASLGLRDVPHHPQSAIRRDNKQSPFTMLDEPAFGQERLAISGTNHSPPIMLLCQAARRKSIFVLKPAVSTQCRDSRAPQLRSEAARFRFRVTKFCTRSS